VARGASATNIYSDRIFSIEPTRLGIDAQMVSDWRKKGFFSVVKHYRTGDQRNLDDSILYQLIAARRAVPDPGIEYNSFSSRSCPNLEASLPKLGTALSSLFRSHPNAAWGMPYGFPPLTAQEFAIIRDWLLLGAPGPNAESIQMSNPDLNKAQIETWEKFFNGPTNKERLVARYIYEHLYYAHIYFSDDRTSPPKFYRLVRSRTAAPEPPSEIATRFPTSYPGGDSFFYRLKLEDKTIVHKTHMPFSFDNKRLEKFKAEFLSDSWDVVKLPGYEAEQAANPFVTFKDIPAKARYRFMLDEAGYFVETFMKGPVCRGQLALNVINDFFFLFFLDPAADVSVNDVRYFSTTAKQLITPFRPEDSFSDKKESRLLELLELPKKALSQLRRTFYPYFKSRQLKYLANREKFLGQRGFGLQDIWDGDGGKNPNAVLTVFRHFDSASVTKGAVGGLPKTAMVLDYPIFERMYYNLVANFDVYGDIKLQLATRLYMDDLRIEGEDLFLSFLPIKDRIAVRNYWYRGAESSINSSDHPFYGTNKGFLRETKVAFTMDSPSPQDLISIILSQRVPSLRKDRLNSDLYGAVVEPNIGPITDQLSLERELSKLGGRHGRYLQSLPPVSLVRFRMSDGDDKRDLVYSFVHVNGHFNVKYIFGESSRLAPEEDTLSIIPNYQGSYPNFFFDVSINEAQRFLSDLIKVNSNDGSFELLVDKFGVQRLGSSFWEHYDWFNERFARTKPIESGVLDLGRYENY
jgi:hypothetical protein